MNARRRMRIAPLAAIVLALAFGSFAATATAHKGSGGDGTTKAGKPVALVGTVATADATARTFTLTVKSRGWKHHGKHRSLARAAHRGGGHRSRAATRTITVHANDLALPAADAKVLVKGTTLEDGTVSATEVKALGDDGDCRGRNHDDDDGDDDR